MLIGFKRKVLPYFRLLLLVFQRFHVVSVLIRCILIEGPFWGEHRRPTLVLGRVCQKTKRLHISHIFSVWVSIGLLGLLGAFRDVLGASWTVLEASLRAGGSFGGLLGRLGGFFGLLRAFLGSSMEPRWRTKRSKKNLFKIVSWDQFLNGVYVIIGGKFRACWQL